MEGKCSIQCPEPGKQALATILLKQDFIDTHLVASKNREATGRWEDSEAGRCSRELTLGCRSPGEVWGIELV